MDNSIEATLNTLLAAYGAGPVRLGEGRAASAIIDGTSVTFSQTFEPLEALGLDFDLGQIDPEDAEATQYLLALGFDTWQANICNIGIDRASHQAFAYTSVNAQGLTPQLLEQTLVHYMGIVAAIRGELASKTGAIPPSNDTPLNDHYAQLLRI